MTEFNLDFLTDTQGNYILKTKIEDESQYRGFFKTTGTYSENLIISTKYFEKKLKHNLDDMVIAIEQAILHKQKVIYDDIIYESEGLISPVNDKTLYLYINSTDGNDYFFSFDDLYDD